MEERDDRGCDGSVVVKDKALLLLSFATFFFFWKKP